MNDKLRVMTIVGTRPEIIRLAPTIKLLDLTTNHYLVHTGQNYDYELNELFFEDLGLKKPNYFLNSDVTSLGATLGSILVETEKVINTVNPDAILVLGDTNSCISAVIGKRLGIPIYHMEAGNRCFDENVPEETNRKLVDHVSDYNLVYSEHARRNLLREGISAERILLTGSPMKEVLQGNFDQIQESRILNKLNLEKNNYFLVSLHREENVDNISRLKEALESFQNISKRYNLPVLISTHPRTQKKLDEIDPNLKNGLFFHKPFGFNDYVHLQQKAKMVLSDSGTISEESSILGFPAITLREAIERPESEDEGAIILAGVSPDRVMNAVEITLQMNDLLGYPKTPAAYTNDDVSRRVVAFIVSTAKSHFDRAGIRKKRKPSS